MQGSERPDSRLWCKISIIACAMGILSLLPILAAGSRRYGFVSRIWQVTGIQSWIVLGFLLQAMGAMALRKAKVSTHHSGLGFASIGFFCLFAIGYSATFILVEARLILGID